MSQKCGFLWLNGLLLVTVASDAAWVLSSASWWSALLVTVGGLAAVSAGVLAFADVRGAGSGWAKSYLRSWVGRSLISRRSAYWTDERRIYRTFGIMTLLLGAFMIVLGLTRYGTN